MSRITAQQHRAQDHPQQDQVQLGQEVVKQLYQIDALYRRLFSHILRRAALSALLFPVHSGQDFRK